MSPINISNAGPQGYPGGYVPNPLISEMYSNVSDESRNKMEYDIVESKKHYKVDLIAPGFKRESFLVNVNEKCSLTVTAMHSKEEKKEMSKYYGEHVEKESLHCKISLPKNIDTDFAIAEYKSGILSIIFSKTDKRYKRRASMIIVY